MATKSWADKAREKQQANAEKAASRSGGSSIEWTPDLGTHKIRILPPLPLSFDVIEKDGTVHPKGSEDLFFYMTHSYHFMDGIGNEGRGKLLWTPKKFDASTGVGLFYHGHTVKTVSDPIDEAVRQMYEETRSTENKALRDMASGIKRKRQYFFNIILLDEKDPEKKFRILIDKTNEGKLARKICEHMGFPFYRDIEDEWVVKESLERDPDRVYFDLVDLDEGHDFKIIKTKTGTQAWDISYDESFVVPKSRALTDEEREYLNQRVDLRAHVRYSDLPEIQLAYDDYFGETKTETKAEAKVEKPSDAAVAQAKKQAAAKQVDIEEDENIDDLLNELDDAS